jgi:hypothetical protein
VQTYIIKQDRQRYQQLPSNLCIDFGDDNYTLKFRVLDTPIAELWVERMNARGEYPLDHPERFYGFNTQAEEIAKAQDLLERCVRIINQFNVIVTRPVDATDQDCLNYLHSIFEKYHGLLDAQQHEFWRRAPDAVKNALAELNINVHRAESAIRSNNPRFVCTWYGMPKTKTLPAELMSRHGTLTTRFGGVYLNYVEIGKTLEDLTVDRDCYIGDDAFKPFNHYSADFVVRFSEVDPAERILDMRTYYNQNQKFFIERGYTSVDDPKLMPLRFPVAELVTELTQQKILEDIGCRQRINRVYFE